MKKTERANKRKVTKVSVQQEHTRTAFLLRRSPHKKTVLCVAPSGTEQLQSKKTSFPLTWKWAVILFLLFCLIFLVIALHVIPDISALEQISSGEPEVPIRNLAGQTIFIYHSPQYGEKIQVSLSEISDEMIVLTLTTEDSRFFSNPGFSPAAIFRAVLQNLHLRTTFSGASTITQQLVRNIFFPESVRFHRSFFRKALEIYLAAAITLRYDKEMILTLYLNEIYYGRYATGVEKAAEVYFGKHASELDLEEAAFLAGLPQAPNYYGNDEAAGIRRQKEVLRLYHRTFEENKCLPLGSGSHPRFYCP